MVETVVGRWSKDISQMESEATERWKNNLSALRNAFNAFEAKFRNEVSGLDGETEALKHIFEEFAQEFKKDVEDLKKAVEEMLDHIWGTQADKEAWQRKYGR